MVEIRRMFLQAKHSDFRIIKLKTFGCPISRRIQIFIPAFLISDGNAYQTVQAEVQRVADKT
jgi:hypothetical protein